MDLLLFPYYNNVNFQIEKSVIQLCKGCNCINPKKGYNLKVILQEYTFQNSTGRITETIGSNYNNKSMCKDCVIKKVIQLKNDIFEDLDNILESLEYHKDETK